MGGLKEKGKEAQSLVNKWFRAVLIIAENFFIRADLKPEKRME